jgi:hypothetical protein
VAYFARVVGGCVVKVHVVADVVVTDAGGVVLESLGQKFLADLWGYEAGEIVQCSYSGDMRNVYPGMGYLYNETLDAFIPPSPHPSWVLNDKTLDWVAPTPKPDGDYVWDEQAGEWVEA